MRSAPVGNQAAGQVRILRAQLRAEANALAGAAWRISPDIIADAAFKGRPGARRAWARIDAAMPCRPLQDRPQDRLAIWRLFRPAGPILARDDGTLQGDDAVVASWLAIGRGRGRAVREEGPWGLSFTSHALGRLLERTSFRGDPVTTMLAAHDALLAAPAAAARTMLDERLWALPAGPGAFLVTMRGLGTAEGDAIVLATAETWIADDQLWPDQEAQIAAVRHRQDGPTLGEGLLLPAIMRPAVVARKDVAGRVAMMAV